MKNKAPKEETPRRVTFEIDPVYIHIGENGWTNMVLPSPAMTLVSNQVWSYTYTPTTGTETINFVFNDGNAVETNKVWDNNNGNDWSLAVSGCGSIVPPPPFAITNPAMDIVVANNVDSRTLQGTALGVTGDIAWTNHLTGGAGSIYEKPVKLQMWVKVEKNWSRNFWLMKKLGYVG